MKTLNSWEDFESLLSGENKFLLFKHSERCGISLSAYHEIQKYMQQENPLDVHMVDVVGSRTLSQRIAKELDVRHESPQVIFIEKGKPGLVLSHYSVRAATLTEKQRST
jgi:bacillithiol system protein YtxJ